jgi:hypothetical protein
LYGRNFLLAKCSFIIIFPLLSLGSQKEFISLFSRNPFACISLQINSGEQCSCSWVLSSFPRFTPPAAIYTHTLSRDVLPFFKGFFVDRELIFEKVDEGEWRDCLGRFDYARALATSLVNNIWLLVDFLSLFSPSVRFE